MTEAKLYHERQKPVVIQLGRIVDAWAITTQALFVLYRDCGFFGREYDDIKQPEDTDRDKEKFFQNLFGQQVKLVKDRVRDANWIADEFKTKICNQIDEYVSLSKDRNEYIHGRIYHDRETETFRHYAMTMKNKGELLASFTVADMEQHADLIYEMSEDFERNRRQAISAWSRNPDRPILTA